MSQSMSRLFVLPVHFAAAGTLSEAVSLNGLLLVGIEMPAEWTAADFTFLAGSVPDVVRDLYGDDDNEVTVQAAEDRYITLANPLRFAGVKFLQVRSGTAATPVEQEEARLVNMIVRQWP